MTPLDHDSTSGPERGPLGDYLSAFGEQYAAAVERATGSEVASPVGRATHHRRRPRLVPTLGIGSVLVVAAAVYAIVALPVGDRTDIVQEASAALGTPGEIIHYRLAQGGSSFQGKTTPPSRCATTPVDVWQATTGPRRWRVVSPPIARACGLGVMSDDGKPTNGAFEQAVSGTTTTVYVPDLDRVDVTTGVTSVGALSAPGLPAPPAQRGAGEPEDVVSMLRAMLAAHRLAAVGGATEESGRRVLHLRGTSHSVYGHGAGRLTVDTITDYVVDAGTFTPIRYETRTAEHFLKGNGRPRDGTFHTSASASFPLFERLPATAANEAKLTIHPAATAHVTTVTLAQRTALVHARLQRMNVIGHRNALRIQAEHRRHAAK